MFTSFVKNNHKIILQGRWVSGTTVSFAAGLWQSPSWGSGGKGVKSLVFFTFGG